MFQRILLRHSKVLYVFVKMGLEKCHVEMICDWSIAQKSSWYENTVQNVCIFVNEC